MSPDSTLENTQSCESGTRRGVLNTLLQRNAIVALGAALLRPILGLFKARRGAAPTQVEKLKVERYSSRPMLPRAGATHRHEGMMKGLLRDNEETAEGSHSLRRRTGPPWRGRTMGSSLHQSSTGGSHHG